MNILADCSAKHPDLVNQFCAHVKSAAIQCSVRIKFWGSRIKFIYKNFQNYFQALGSPLLHEKNLVGIQAITPGSGCPAATPAVFTDLGKFSNWVKKNSKSNANISCYISALTVVILTACNVFA